MQYSKRHDISNLDSLLERLLGGFNFTKFKQMVHDGDIDSALDYCNDHLKWLGAGSSRTVYALSTSKVLKIATAKAGRAQNAEEVAVYTNPATKPIITKIYDFDDKGYTWLVSEIAKESDDPLAPFAKAFKISKDQVADLFDTFDSSSIDSLLRTVISYSKKDGLNPDVKKIKAFVDSVRSLMINNDLTPGDIAPSHFGQTADGRIVLFDYGLTWNVARKYYDPYGSGSW